MNGHAGKARSEKASVAKKTMLFYLKNSKIGCKKPKEQDGETRTLDCAKGPLPQEKR